ncbi:2-phosphoglycerate kinase [Methanobrevibacter sp.]|uniref:2-phosphoglycerate kinase n=1 Tax=Methanobrevibacter sp. TaxID=66852 RepID=UPI002E76D490|nr:2-phosphoglycerate kinase [Methanobrevibacter sp.]MEE0025540.1 2-phosphoglycerate kinase [Methanobrevibacter sp.]
MIWVVGNVDGNYYKEPFSKGVLARSLRFSNLGLDQAYEIASDIETKLIENEVDEISLDELSKYISDYLKKIDPGIAFKYKRLSSLRKSNEPLIILIGGASGVGTSSMAFELANRLGLKNIISTDMIREVMRKIISKELNPVIHKSSFDAYESIRTPAIRVDTTIEGFISHVDVVNVGIEAIVERSIKEGISIIIEGVHVVPGFIREDLINKGNIIILTLIVEDEEMHKQRFYSRCRQPWVKRSLDHYMDNFDTIRKTQDFLISQANIHNSCVINNVDYKQTIDLMVNDIIKEFGGETNDK